MLDLRKTTEYADWVGDMIDNFDGVLVLEREIDEPIEGFASTLVSVVRRTNGNYNVFRTFGLAGDGAVSVDLSDVTADKVFEALLDRYSRKRQ